MDGPHNDVPLNDSSRISITSESTLINFEDEIEKVFESPIFCIGNRKTYKGVSAQLANWESSDDDIPSYQVNQSVYKKTPSKSENETNDIKVPLSPVFSPIIMSSCRLSMTSINESKNFAQNNFQNELISEENKSEPKKAINIYENLKMTDEDISWVSSMATPPAPVPNTTFNTIERATFLPDEFHKIQPRALFSPSSDDNCGCSPLPVSSASEEEEEAYQTKARLSDVCATLKELEFRPQDNLSVVKQDGNSESRKECKNDNHPMSPVFLVKPKKLNSNKKKKMIKISLEPEPKDDLICSNVGEKNKLEKKIYPIIAASSQQQNFNAKDDDSFLDVSFSELDRMCNSLLNSKNITKKNIDLEFLDNTVSQEKSRVINSKVFQNSVSVLPKIYYHSEVSADIEFTGKYFSFYDEVLNHHNLKQIFNSNSEKKNDSIHTPKHQQSTFLMKDTKAKTKKKSQEKEQNVDTCFGDEEEIMLKAVEEAEKTLVEEAQLIRAIDEMEGTLYPFVKEISAVNDSTLRNKPFKEKPSNLKIPLRNSIFDLTSTFSSLKKLNKAENTFMSSEAGFSTASGSKVSVSKEAIEKAKIFIEKCEQGNTIEKAKIFIEKCEQGNTIEKVNECYSPNSSSSCEFMPLESHCLDQINKKESLKFETSKIKTTSLPYFCLDQDKDLANLGISQLPQNYGSFNDSNNRNFHEEIGSSDINPGFLTASGSKVSVSKSSLIKARELMSKCDDVDSSMSETRNSFTSYPMRTSTPLPGHNKLKKLIKKGNESKSMEANQHDLPRSGGQNFLSRLDMKTPTCNNRNNRITLCNDVMTGIRESESFVSDKINYGFSTASGLKVLVSKEALLKAKAMMENVEKEPPKNLFSEKFIEKDTFTSLPKKSDNIQEFSIMDSHEILGLGKKISGCSKMSKNEEKSFFKASNIKDRASPNSAKKIKLQDFDSMEEKLQAKYIKATSPLQSDFASIKESKIEPEPFFLGFTSCLGKKIEVSSEALQKSRQLMSLSNDTFKNDCFVTKCQKVDLAENSNSNYIYTSMDDVKEKMEFNELSSNVLKEKVKSPSPSRKHKENAAKKVEEDTWQINRPLMNPLRKQLFSSESFQRCPDDEKVFKFERREAEEADDIQNKVSDNNNGEMHTSRKEDIQGLPNCKTHIVKKYSSPKKITALKRSIVPSEDFSESSKKIKLIADGVSSENSIFSAAEKSHARKNQERVIEEKGKLKPLMGSHLKKKLMTKQITLMEAVEYSTPINYFKDNKGNKVSDAISFKFRIQDFFGPDELNQTIKVQLSDGFEVIPNDEGLLGVKEFKRGFLAGPGVQPDLLPNNWIENHYKWIIWKLIDYEMAFSKYFKGKALTPDNVMMQLKYRYDREIDRSERSALKKILEKDDASIKRMVLRICNIKKITCEEIKGYELELTDGWYSCPGRIDAAMVKLIDKGIIMTGMKLITQGALLVNCDHGMSPLEITDDVNLQISTNSTRKAVWNAKLGFQKNPGNIKINLDSILPDGGAVSRVDVIIVRVYPLLYSEKTSDGRRIVRNRRSEEKAESNHRKLVEQRLEKIYSQVRCEIFAKKGKKSEENFSQDVDVSQINSPRCFSSESKEHDNISREISSRVDEILKNENLSRRDVCEFLKVKTVDLERPNFSEPTVVSIWNPGEEIFNMLTEGKTVSLTNLAVSNFSRGDGSRQINATRQTRFKVLNRLCDYPPRHLTPFEKISTRESPIFGEIDMVGVVVSLKNIPVTESAYETIYFADLEFNFAGVSFWGSCKDYGWENVLVCRRVIACSNLCWKPASKRGQVPVLRAKETSVFSENPRSEYLKEGVEKLKQNLPKDMNEFILECENKLRIKLENPNKPNESLADSFLETNNPNISPEKNLTGLKETKVKESKFSASSKYLEKVQKTGGKSSGSPFRWLPYKNV